MDLSFIINHLGEERDQYFNAVAPPIIQSSNFCYPNLEAMREAAANESVIPLYTRGKNPTVDILCQKLAALDEADAALVFASGSAAVSAAVLGNAQAGDHIICVQKPYSWTYKLLAEFLPRYGVETTFVDGTDTNNFLQALRPNTKIIFLESPNTFTFELQDVAAVAALAKGRGILTIMDNSFAGLLNPSPLKMGVDIIVYSATKYHNGHSDVVAGALSCSKAMYDKLFRDQYMLIGGIVQPFEAWLMLRSLRTLEVRLNRINESTPKILDFLENHPKIEKVYYPFSKHNPQLELAKKQLVHGNGLLSFAVKTEHLEGMERFSNSLKRFLLAVSWGGYESLALPVAAFYKSSLPFNLVRISIGLEDPDVLIQDLDQALALV